jgi:hypothetical protein
MALKDQLTLVELAKRTNNKQMLDIAEVLDKKVPMLRDAVWLEANQLTGHVINRRTYLPTGTFRGVNEGVPKSASQTKQITEPIGRLEDRSEVDEYLIDLAPNPKEFRYDEDIAHVEGLAQTMGDAILYAALATDPLKFDGIQTRYDALSLANVWDNGDASSGAVTSAYLIQWGKRKAHFVYPRNLMNEFIRMVDKGQQLVEDGITAGNKFWAYVTQFVFNMGISVWDDRCIQRIANIGPGTANNFDIDLGIKALNEMPDEGDGAVLYVNTTVKSQIEIAAKNAADPILRWTKVDGVGDVLMFKNAPVRVHEKIKNTESVVS